MRQIMKFVWFERSPDLLYQQERGGGNWLLRYPGVPSRHAGQWAIIPMGFWAPTSQFAKYLPSLLKIAESYSLNEEWAREYVRQGQERVRELMKR
jgi:hypothetical protein